MEKKKKSKFTWLVCFVICLALALSFGFLAMAQASQYSALRADLIRIEADIDRALAERERLQRQLQFVGSDAYIEEQARRLLGLVLPTELIFRNVGQ